MIDLGPYMSSLRMAGGVIGGIAVTLGVMSSTDVASTTQALNDIGEGVKLIMKGGGVLLPIGLGVWGAMKARLSSKVSDVKIAAPADLAVAMTKIAPAEMVIAVKDMPEVKGVVTNQTPDGIALARSIPSSAVAAAGSSDAAAIAKPGV